MKKILGIKNVVFIALIYIVLAVIAFYKFPLTFFQQDEWLIFGDYIYWEKAGLNWLDRLFVYKQFSHVIPLTHFFSYLQFKLFSINFYPYAVTSITIHIFNGLLVYLLSVKLLNNKFIGFIAGLLFIVNPITHQGITWIATTTGTAVSTTFFLLSLISFFTYLNKSSVRYFLLSSVFLIVSLLFKETSVFGFVFFPIVIIIYKLNKISIQIKKISFYFIIIGFIYLLFRFTFLFYAYNTSPLSSQLTQPGLNVFLYRGITAPLKFITQSIIPVEIIVDNAKRLIRLGYPQYELFVREGEVNPFIAETVAADIVSYVFALFILVCVFALVRYYKKSNPAISRGLILSLLFIWLSAMPYIIIPGKAGYFSLLDGRHLYPTSIFVAVLIGLLLWSIGDLIKFKKKFVVSVLVFLLTIFNITSIQKDMERLIKMGMLRKAILTKIQTAYPKLPSKVIMYAESDASYYAAEGKILPFQSGLGQTLLIWYTGYGENFPACFFKEDFLYDWVSEGYKECGSRGYGYFRQIDSLRAEIRKSNLPIENIIGFRFSSSNESLSDITSEIRNSIKGD